MQSFTLLVFLAHFSLYDSAPMVLVGDALRATSELKSSTVPLSESRLGFIGTNPASKGAVDHTTLEASHLTPNHELPKLPDNKFTTESVDFKDIKFNKGLKDVKIDEALKDVKINDRLINKKKIPPSESDSTLLAGEELMTINKLHPAVDLEHTAPVELREQSGAIPIYRRLRELSEPAPAPQETIDWNFFAKKSLKILTNPRELMQQLISTSEHYISNAASWMKGALEEPESPEAVLQLSREDATLLYNKFVSVHREMNNKIFNKYFEVFSISDKEPTAMIEFNPTTQKLLDRWQEYNMALYLRLQSFMVDSLPQMEFARRFRVLESQAEQFKISQDWGSTVKSISEETGIETQLVSKFGEKLGGKNIFTSFENHDYKATLNELESLKEAHDGLDAAWRAHLGADYESRVNLLKTLSELKHPNAIPSDTISAWLSQGMDAKRMLKIVDYIEESFQNVGENEKFLLSNLKNMQDLEEMSSLIFPNNQLKSVPESLEHGELLKLPKHQSERYRDFFLSLKEHKRLPYIKQVVKPNVQKPHLSFRQKLLNAPWWKSWVEKAKKLVDSVLRFLPAPRASKVL